MEDATTRLGINTLRTLVLASAVTGAFQSSNGFYLKGFWLHSFKVASLCRLLAKQHGVASETAFTCGMMHNIGELLIQTGAADIAARLNRKGASDSAGRVAQETLQLGFGYPEVGAELARRWQLPGVIQQAIALQARPHESSEDRPLPRLLAQAVLIAEALEQHPDDLQAAQAELDNPLCEGLDLPALFDKLPEVLEADKAFAELLN